MNKLIRDGEEMEKQEKPEITLEELTVTGIFGAFFGIFPAIIMVNLVKGYIPGPFSIFLTPVSYIFCIFYSFSSYVPGR